MVEVAKTAGFCFGVRRAVETAERACAENGGIWALGDIIHNTYEVERLRKLGVQKADTLEEIPDGADVLIRAHGVPERTYRELEEKGCRIVDDYDNSYLLSVVELDKSKYKTSSVMNRVAQVKSQRNAGEFFNGTQSYSEITIRTPKSEEKGGKEMAETYEIIRTNSTGFVQQLALLTQFESNNGTAVFVFYKKVNK